MSNFKSVFLISPNPNPLPEGKGTGSPHGLAGLQHPHNPEPCAPLPVGEGQVSNFKSVFLISPHPNPLPEGEGYWFAARVSWASTSP
ncbi:conserved hypothetical protein [Enterobacterales bacterium 8AC]|nr:conserved hypothetical protein [Enterobacterales bacterium 8AC]